MVIALRILRRLPVASALTIWVALALLAQSGCTVDLGPDTGPPQACNAPADFYLTDMWPKYFETYTCGRSNCHDASTGIGYFRIENVSMTTPPMPGTPSTSWPTEWQNNLRSVERNISCANPLQSNVLITPTNRGQKHPTGIVSDIPGADALFTEWLTK